MTSSSNPNKDDEKYISVRLHLCFDRLDEDVIEKFRGNRKIGRPKMLAEMLSEETGDDVPKVTTSKWFSDENTPSAHRKALSAMFFRLLSPPCELPVFDSWLIDGPEATKNPFKDQQTTNNKGSVSAAPSPMAANPPSQVQLSWEAIESILKVGSEQDISDPIGFCDRDVIDAFIDVATNSPEGTPYDVLDKALLERLVRIEIQRVKREIERKKQEHQNNDNNLSKGSNMQAG